MRMVHTANGTVKRVSGVPFDPQRPYLGKFSHLFRTVTKERKDLEDQRKVYTVCSTDH